MTGGRVAALLAAGALLVSSCTPGAREAAPFQGTWRSEPWGIDLAVNGGSVEIFEFSPVHCISVAAGGARGIADVLSMDGDQLVLRDAGRTIRFDSVGSLPAECAGEPDQSPPSSFDVAAATFEAHYAPGVDPRWGERVAALRPGPEDAPRSLFSAITSLLEPLGDPDLRLAAGDLGTWRSFPKAEVARPEGASIGNGGILTADLDGDIGYIAFDRFGGFADDLEASQRAAADALDATLAVSRALILDLRAADGGTLDHAMLVASRFVPSAGLVATLEARGPAGFVPAGDVTVTPHPLGTFDGPLMVLVGPGTIGVAELLAHALRSMAGATLVGSTTGGAPGPRMVRFLPNGWSLGLGNLRVVAADGRDIGDGVEPDLTAEDALAASLQELADG